jgi:ribosomal peptide maturation radical SAM protein 1
MVFPIALLSMPFARLAPSPQLGLLKAIAEAEGFPAETFHYALDFAGNIGTNEYEALAEHRGVLLGEWLFSTAAFGRDVPECSEGFLFDFSLELGDLLDDIGKPSAWLTDIRTKVAPAYIDHLSTAVEWNRFKLVGFTSTFQQNAASFAFAKLLKRMYPELLIVVGGANFDGPMGGAWLEALPFIDYAVVGEGDLTFPKLLKALDQGTDPLDIRGLVGRKNGKATSLRPREPLRDLDRLPMMNLDEYFARESKCFPHEPKFKAIPFESSRGCWWGEKNHCTFCGLNGSIMTYRSKSPERVLRELLYYKDRYQVNVFEATDNIVDHRYLSTFFPLLRESGVDLELFYEVKSNLKKDSLRLLKEAGVKSIQPGIESLNTAVLRLMRKGVTGIQNVNLLRWSRFYGLHTSWNLLYGFPGETSAYYDQQNRLLPALHHLQPPMGLSRIWIERFSPIFKQHENIPNLLRPEPSYTYIYPSSVDLAKAAYFFVGDLEATIADSEVEQLSKSVQTWTESWDGANKPSFTFSNTEAGILVQDRRRCDAGVQTILTGIAAEIYKAASEQPISRDRLAALLSSKMEVIRLSDELDELTRSGLMIREDDSFLSLALPEPIQGHVHDN